jgi:hypothetical protein
MIGELGSAMLFIIGFELVQKLAQEPYILTESREGLSEFLFYFMVEADSFLLQQVQFHSLSGQI